MCFLSEDRWQVFFADVVDEFPLYRRQVDIAPQQKQLPPYLITLVLNVTRVRHSIPAKFGHALSLPNPSNVSSIIFAYFCISRKVLP
jgi:hypothetical protein